MMRCFIRTVAANSEEVDAFVTVEGTNYEIYSTCGSADFTGKTRVEIIYDEGGENEAYYMLTYGDMIKKFDPHAIVGDGVKTIKSKLINNSSEAVKLGSAWEAYVNPT